MERPTILVAVAPEAMASVRELLGDEFVLLPVGTLGEALERVADGGIDAILAGLHFDDSLMPTLLDTVKRQPATRDIPFVCCRLLPTMLLQASLRAARHVCDALDAQFVDVLEIRTHAGPAAAAEHLRGVLAHACANQRGVRSRSLHGGSRPP